MSSTPVMACNGIGQSDMVGGGQRDYFNVKELSKPEGRVTNWRGGILMGLSRKSLSRGVLTPGLPLFILEVNKYFPKRLIVHSVYKRSREVISWQRRANIKKYNFPYIFWAAPKTVWSLSIALISTIHNFLPSVIKSSAALNNAN